jgi:prepilin-type N-terminal cleavage/methylation domain-containing protein
MSRRTKRAGFTLVEVLVALTILGVGIIGVTVLFPVSLKQTRRAAGISSAKNVAVGLTKKYQAQGYDGIVWSYGADKDGDGKPDRVHVIDSNHDGLPDWVVPRDFEAIGEIYTLYQPPSVRFSMPLRHFASTLRLYRVSITMDLPDGGREDYVTFVAKE